MIKQLYHQVNKSHADSEDIMYSVTLDACKDYFKIKLKEQKGLRGDEYNTFVRHIVNDYIETCKPVITDMLQQDGTMNYKMLSLRLYEDINEFGPITEALTENWTDIICSGIGPGNLNVMKGMVSSILRDSNGNILYFKTVEEIESVVNRLAYFDGAKRLTTRQPILRCTTPQGYRLTAIDKCVSAPVVLADKTKLQVPTFDIRMTSKEPLTLDDMIWKKRTMSPEIARALVIMMGLEGIKIVFSGVPGSGKTTTLYEVLRKLEHKSVVCIAETPEGELWVYDEKGTSTRIVKSWSPTEQDEGSNDMTKGTITNLFYAILSTKTDIIALSEVRSTNEINIMLNVGVSGKAMATTMHGENLIATIERCVKDIMSAKSCSRSEAIMEASLSINIVVGMYHEPTDHSVRLGYISELETYETSSGVSVREHKLYEFRRTAGVINPATGFISGQFCKVGIPSKKLQAYMDVTPMSIDDREFLMAHASEEEPIVFPEKWWK